MNSFWQASGPPLIGLALTVFCTTASIAPEVTTGAGPAIEKDPQEDDPPWHLLKAPNFAFDSSAYAASEEQTAQIRSLIRDLTRIASPDFGLSPSLSGTRFAPLPDTENFSGGLLGVPHGIRQDDMLEQLVGLGPRALPFLLEALDDDRKTGLAVNAEDLFGVMWHAKEAFGNKLSPHEKRALVAHPGIHSSPLYISEERADQHEVTVADVCFVAIGQITNRPYQAMRYQPSGHAVINSPTASPELTAYLRDIWSLSGHEEKLFRWLLLDFHTRGTGSEELQVGAAQRLLYYFPGESIELICARIRDSGTGDGYVFSQMLKGLRFSDEEKVADAVYWRTEGTR